MTHKINKIVVDVIMLFICWFVSLDMCSKYSATKVVRCEGQREGGRNKEVMMMVVERQNDDNGDDDDGGGGGQVL